MVAPIQFDNNSVEFADSWHTSILIRHYRLKNTLILKCCSNAIRFYRFGSAKKLSAGRPRE